MVEKEKEVCETKPKQTIFDGPGRGRKGCTNCKTFVGVKTKVCPKCGQHFEKGKSLKPVDKFDDDPIMKEGTEWAYTVGKTAQQVVVLTPSGECPIPLDNGTREEVWDWCEMMLAEGRNNNKLYTPSALRYFILQTFMKRNLDCQLALCNLKDWIEEKKNVG